MSERISEWRLQNLTASVNDEHPPCWSWLTHKEAVDAIRAERTRVHELEAKNERLGGTPSAIGLPDCEDDYVYSSVSGRCYHFEDNHICPLEPLCHDENIEGKRYEVIVRAALGTRSATDSDLPEGAVVCPDCGGRGSVYSPSGAFDWGGGTSAQHRDTCPTCHGKGHVCEVCGGAVGKPRGTQLTSTSSGQWFYYCTADYHKEES